MSRFETAAQDPIFWLHHANVDYLWEVWLRRGGGRANPTDAAWLNQVFVFYDENGGTVSMTAAQVLTTASQLQYSYQDACVAPPPSPPTNLRITPGAFLLEQGNAGPSKRTPLVQPGRNAVIAGNSSAQRLIVTTEGRNLFEQFASARGQKLLKLVISEIEMLANPSVIYELYVNLPDSGRATVTYSSPNYI